MLQKKKRIDSLQILRAIAFFEIFLGHCGVAFFTGAFGVSIFMVLSGFCIGMKYLAKPESINVSFLHNVKSAVLKVKKLYGLHLIMLFFAFLLAQCPASWEAIRKLLLDMALLQSLSPHSADFFSYNGVAWYLSMFFFVSIFSGYAVWITAKMKNKNVKGIWGAAIYGLMVLIGIFVSKKHIPMGDNFAFWLTYISPFYRVLEFLLGVILGGCYLEYTKEKSLCESRQNVSTQGMSTLAMDQCLASVVEVFAAAAFVGIICIFHKIEGVYDGLCYTALFTPVSMLLVVVFTKNAGWITRLLNNPFFLWVGNISAYTFLIHQVVIRWLQRLLPEILNGDVPKVLLILLSFGITAAGAEIVRMAERLSEKKRLNG